MWIMPENWVKMTWNFIKSHKLKQKLLKILSKSFEVQKSVAKGVQNVIKIV